MIGEFSARIQIGYCSPNFDRDLRCLACYWRPYGTRPIIDTGLMLESGYYRRPYGTRPIIDTGLMLESGYYWRPCGRLQ